ncbi:ornithine cyclodeaminase [Mariniluteicoccus endophyticus]
MKQPRWIDEEAVRAFGPDRARRALHDALAAGLDPATDPARTAPAAGTGHLLVMPSAWGAYAGVKVASVAPENPAKGHPRIQAVYVLLDGGTLTPHTLLDGAELTALRTPAMSAVGVDALTAPDVDTVVVLGTGPQAVGHVHAVLACRTPQRVLVAGRDAARAQACVDRVEAPAGVAVEAVSTDDLAALVPQAQLVVCCTSAKDPVIDSGWVADDACVVAVGSHEPDRRELDAALMGRSQVVVEDRETALREAGDVIQAIDEGPLTADALAGIADVVARRAEVRRDCPRVFKTVGMSWQDLVVAAAVAEA